MSVRDTSIDPRLLKSAREEMHVLCTSFWTSIYEPFVHNMTWKEIEDHCKVLCRFFNWSEAISIK